MQVKQIEAWKATLRDEVQALTDKIQDLSLELQKKRQQLELVAKLLAFEIGPTEGAEATEKPFISSTTPDDVKDRAFQILNEIGRPMNIKEIHSEFLRRSLPIPGKGTAFNILVHLSKEIRRGKGSRFYRTGKGTYAIRHERAIRKDGEPSH